MSDPTVTNGSFRDGVQFAWDATSISLADECLQKYWLRQIIGWRGRGESVHLVFGGLFATALEHYYKYMALGQTSAEALSMVVYETLVATWDYEWTEDEIPVRIPGTGAPHQFEPHAAKTRENLIRTIIWYVDQYEDEDIKVLTLSNGLPAVEYTFTLPVDNDIVLVGHIDRMVDYNSDPYVMDQKTTGSTISQSFFEQFRTAHQFSMYTFAGQIIYNAPVKGVIIDGAQIAVGFSRFERGFSFRTDSQLREWYDDAMGIIEMAREATKEGYFPMRRTSCNNYGGCEFRGICGRSPEVRKNFLEADFVRKPTWDPMERR